MNKLELIDAVGEIVKNITEDVENERIEEALQEIESLEELLIKESTNDQT